MAAPAIDIVTEALDQVALGASRPPNDLQGRIDQLKHLRTVINDALAAIGEDEREPRTGPGVTW